MELREIWMGTRHRFNFHILLLLFEFLGRSGSLHLIRDLLVVENIGVVGSLFSNKNAMRTGTGGWSTYLSAW